jgi:predicted transcriptional regulator
MSEYTENKVNRSPKKNKKVGRPPKKTPKNENENKKIPRTVERSFKILDLIKEEPLSVIEIASNLGIDRRRVNEIVNNLIFLKKVTRIRNKIADINYGSLEEKIEREIDKKLKFNENRFPSGKRFGQMIKKELFRKIDKEFMIEVADSLEEICDEDFTKAFMRVCKKKNLRIHNINKKV